jgi:hypothetical protein
MSTTYRDELTARVRDLWQAVTELVVIAFEDRPPGVDLIAMDELCDRASDLQGAVHELQQACVRRGGDPADSLVTIGELLDQTARTYWRELFSGRALADLTVTGRRRGDELAAWSQSLAVALAQCEEPLTEASKAWRFAWPELLRARQTDGTTLLSPNDPNSQLKTTVEVPR